MGEKGMLRASRNGNKIHVGPLAKYTQDSVFSHMFGADPDEAHSAEADCMALLRIMTALGPDFNDFLLSKSAKKFDTVVPMR